MKLNKVACGLAAGIIWGLTIFIATIWVIVSGGGGEHLALLNRFYIGYSVTYGGSFLGLIYGFVDGFVFGWLFAFLYNLFVRTKEAQGS